MWIKWEYMSDVWGKQIMKRKVSLVGGKKRNDCKRRKWKG